MVLEGAPSRSGLPPPAPPPHVPAAALGDGSLLVLLGADGDPLQAFWPHPDRVPNLARMAFGVVVDGAAQWVAEGVAEQHGEAEAGVVRTTVVAGGRTLGFADVAATDGPALVRRVTVDRPTELLVRFVPHPAGEPTRAAPRGDDRPWLAVAWPGRALVVAVDAPGEVAFDDDGGDGDGFGATLRATVGDAATVVVAFATDLAGAEALAVRLLERGAEDVTDERRAVDAALIARRTPTLVDGDLDALDRASVRALALLTDRANGATIAGPDCDPEHARSGGYGYVWPRDLALIVLAELAAGLHDEARAAVRWLVRAQSSDGLWEQRHHSDATVAPGWGRQLDETGASLFALVEAATVLRDAALADEVWPAVVAAADALAATLDPVTGLPAPSFDLWEERFGVHAFTAAATVGGLEAAARLAATRRADGRGADDRLADVDDGRARAWRDAAVRVRAGIDRWLWSDEHGRFLRSRDVARPDAGGAPVPDGYLRAARPEWAVVSVEPIDATVDVSLAGLVHPFRVLAHDDPRVVATLAAIDERITGPRGGVGRYEGDPYVGGNPWVLAGLWVGLARRAAGAAVPADGLALAGAVATPTWLLPEQFAADTLEPRWIVPLAWSHALVLLAVRSDAGGAAAIAMPNGPGPRR